MIKRLRSVFGAAAALGFFVAPSVAQLPVEPIPNVESLPEKYPDNWLFARDLAFYSLASGRVYIVDPASEERDVHGIIDAAQMAAFEHSATRRELYVAETFYSRGMRGKRQDFLTIYGGSSLEIIDQIELPGAKRYMSVTHKNAMQLTRDDKFLLIANFTPASSVSVFDLDARTVVNEIQMPGCMLVYPHGLRGFASLCGDGSLIAFDLDETGQPINEFRTEAFNDIDADPLFMKVAIVGDTVYFPSFKGYVQSVRLAGGEPEIGDRVYLAGSVRESPHGAYARPSGWQVITEDTRGRIYLLMRADARDGDHKYGGSIVWVYDPKSGRVIREIPLKANSVSIEVTRGRNPALVATNEAMHLDIYDLKSGEHLRKIGGWSAFPFALQAVQ